MYCNIYFYFIKAIHLVDHAVIIAVGDPNHKSRLTHQRVHAMLPALGKPLVSRIMSRLYRAGIRNYTVIVGENDGAVASYLNTSWAPDIHIEFKLMAGRLSLPKILKGIATEYNTPFIVSNYNSFTQINFIGTLLKHYHDFPDSLILTASSRTSSTSGSPNRNAFVRDSQVIQFANGGDPALTEELSICTLAELGICGTNIINFFKDLPDEQHSRDFTLRFMDMAREYISNNGQNVIAETSWLLQVETDTDLLTLNRRLLDEGHDAHILSEIPTSVQIVEPVRIDPQVSIGNHAHIGPHVYLERGSSVGQGANLSNVIALEKANIPANERFKDTIFTNRGAVL
jgi:NDP-sugar pyrophosphorylase family protein